VAASRPQTQAAAVQHAAPGKKEPQLPAASAYRFLERIPFIGSQFGPTKELATILYKKWVTLESLFTDTVKFALRSLRTERAEIAQYFYDVRISFKEFINRPDDKQPSVESFIREFNSLEDYFK
jgi:hypothetical protein